MKKNYFLTLLLTLFISGLSFGQVFITELADPNNNSNTRYIELYNAGESSVDLSTWRIDKYTNASATVSQTLALTGTIAEGGFYIIATGPSDSEFFDVFGVTPDQWDAGSNNVAGSNGDDNLELYDGSGTLVDQFGVPGEDGTGTCHEFEDGRAERIASVSSGVSTWNEAEWNVWADSTVSGCTNHTNSPRSAPTDYDPGAWIGAASGPSISVGSAVTGLDYFEGSGPSAEGVFQISGINLTADVSVTAPTNFEVSLTSSGTFTSSVTLTQSSGIASGAVYVRLVSGLSPDTYTGNATVASAGADSQTVSLTGTVTAADPQITVTAFLDDFNYIISVGGPSPEDSFSVEGLFLQDDISVTAPANYEVSLTTATGFASSVSITPDQAGTVASTEVFVRLAAGLSAGNYTGNISVSSTGVTEELIAVNGNAYGAATNSMVITGAYDGPLSGGTPKGIELYVLQDISDLSLYGISSITNGQGSSSGNVEYNFPADEVTAGTYIYLATESSQFTTFFGIAPTYTNGVVSINGDDSIELYENGQIIDTFGDVNTDGSGEAWDYLDGWAYRNSNTGPEGTTFTPTNWSYSGANAFDGESDNASATTPFPIGTYSNTTASVGDNSIAGFSTYPNPVRGNILTVTTSSTDTKTVNIFNVLGKKVFSQTFSSMTKTMNVSEIASGVYIMKVTEGNNIATKKLIIE